MSPRENVALPGFTDNLNRLLETYRWQEPDGQVRGFGTATLAQRLRALGYSFSDSYIVQLRTGAKSNPSAVLIAGLSRAFEVDVRYWFDPDVTVEIQQQLDARLERLHGNSAAG